MFYFHSQYGSTVGTVAMDTAGRDGRVVSVTGLGSRGRGFESRCRKK